jgi:uncharacterized phage protein (TIGR02218 family)
MRPAGAGLIAYLNATTATPPMAHLVTFTPKVGSAAYWTDWTSDLTVGGHTFKAGGQGTTFPIPRVTKRREVAGMEIGSVSLTLECGETAALNGTLLPVAAAQRVLDGATVLVERLYMPTPGDVSLGAMHLFQGYVGEVKAGGLSVEIEVESGVALLNVEIPRITFQAGCPNTLYDGICGLTRGDFTVTGTVSSGATTTTIPTSRTEATGTINENGWYALGVIAFTSGACNGEKRTVRTYSNTGGTFTLDRPLPAAPGNGDTFSVYPGCPKTIAACENNTAASGPQFNNRAHFRGFPFVPKNEVAM